ncbi:ribonuclease D [Haliea sp. E17]|uniref:ribonuclease D n=1 Tax=Haliea sp. E17 TaxID=3401576 RepID=UPI003AAE0420
MDWQLIESDAALAGLLARAEGCSAVMVDTEFMRRNTFFPQVALLQLCFDDCDAAGTAWLIDPLKVTELDPLRALLQDARVVKVLHSASEDLEVFQRWLGVLPAPLFDTQKAAALVGMDFGLGYRNTVLELCGEDLPKGETRSDWLQRPLTESQCHYAAQDVIWLLQVYHILAQRCREQDRFDWVLEEGAAACNGLASDVGGYYLRIKQAWKLAPRQLATLIAVCDWRDQVARDEDRPRSWIIDDQACMQLARLQPRDMGQLRGKVEMHPRVLRRHGEALLELVAAQDHLSPEQLPETLPEPLAARQRDQLKQLKQRLEHIGRDLGIAPQMLLSSRDLEQLLRDGAAKPPQWQGWRQPRVIEPLCNYLRELAA